jgi:uncharacterized protein YjhX (UPF0386 family)
MAKIVVKTRYLTVITPQKARISRIACFLKDKDKLKTITVQIFLEL